MFERFSLRWSRTNKSYASKTLPALTSNVATLLLGLIISAILFVVVLHQSREKELQQAYQEEAAPLTIVLGRSIEQYLNSITSISGLYAASDGSGAVSFAPLSIRTSIPAPTYKLSNGYLGCRPGNALLTKRRRGAMACLIFKLPS